MPIINPEKEFREGVAHNARLSHSPGRGHLNPVNVHEEDTEVSHQIVVGDQPVDQLRSEDIDDVFNYRDLFIEEIEECPEANHNNQINNITRFSDGPVPPTPKQLKPHLSASMTHMRIIDVDVIDIDGERSESEGDGDTTNYVDIQTINDNNNNNNNNRGQENQKNSGWEGVLKCERYKVGLNLQNVWKVQAHFFTKIMIVKTIQLAFINLWIALIHCFSDLKHFTIENSDWLYLALAIFVGILITVRMLAKTRSNWHPALIIATLIALTICIAFVLGGATYSRTVYTVPNLTGILMFTFLLLSVTPYFTRVPITDPAITRAGGILVLIVSTILLIICVYSLNELDISNFATKIWLPAVLLAELVVYVTLYEIQRIISGWSFHVSERRWLFAALYV